MSHSMQVQAYIDSIRNDAKQQYAIAYWRYLRQGQRGVEPDRGRLSYMAAQAVRMRLTEYYGKNPRHARTVSGRIRELVREGRPDGHGQAGAIAYRERREGKIASNPRRKGSAEFSGYLSRDGSLVDSKGFALGTWRASRTLKAYRPPPSLDYLTDSWEAVEFVTAKGKYAGGLSMGIGMLVRLEYIQGGPDERKRDAISYAEYVLDRDIEEAESSEEAGEE